MTTFFDGSPFPVAADISDKELADIGTILVSKKNICLSGYKSACIKRRIAIRMRATGSATPVEYCSLLFQSEKELDLLQKVLTIHVSQFFRNPTLFEKLREEVLPALFAAARQYDAKTLRIWCLGCASGEEPYSLAIMLKEYFQRELRQVTTIIVGTDIDHGTLEEADKAVYDEERLKGISSELRERYFRPHEGRYRVVHDIREMVSFMHGDISDFGHYSHSQLVLCRNTLIYFTRPEQERILNGIAEILPKEGIMVLGKSETLVGSTRRRFSPVSQTERIYRKIA